MTEYHILVACSGFLSDSTLMSETKHIARMINRSTETHRGPIVIHVIDRDLRFQDTEDHPDPPDQIDSDLLFQHTPDVLHIPFMFKITLSSYDEETILDNLTTQLRDRLDGKQNLARFTEHVKNMLAYESQFRPPPQSPPQSPPPPQPYLIKKINESLFLEQITKKDDVEIRTKFGPDGSLLKYLEINKEIMFDMVIFASCNDPEILFGLLTHLYDITSNTDEYRENYTDTKEFDHMMDTSFTSRLKDGAYFLEIHYKKFVHYDDPYQVSLDKIARRQPYLQYIDSRFDKVEDGEDRYYRKKPSQPQRGGAHDYNKYKHAYNLLISRS